MIQIQSGSFQECVDLSNQIPEFDSPYALDEYEKRCEGAHLSLNAFVDEKPVGFKVGYDRFKDGSFYSWMGGVLPKYRRQGQGKRLHYHSLKNKEKTSSHVRILYTKRIRNHRRNNKNP